MHHVGPEGEQGPRRPGHRDLLLGERAGREVVRDVVVRPRGGGPVGDALADGQRDDLGGAVLLADVREEDPARHLRGRVGPLGDDEAVVAEVAVVLLVVVGGAGVLGPQLCVVEPQVGRAQEALRQVEEVGMEGEPVQVPRSPRPADEAVPLVVASQACAAGSAKYSSGRG